MGDKKGVKGAVWIYRPYRHDRLLRDDVHRIPVSDVQLVMWYGRREEMRQVGLPFQVVRDAYVNLLPSDQFEERETTSDQSEQDQEGRKEHGRSGRARSVMQKNIMSMTTHLSPIKSPRRRMEGKQTLMTPSFCPSR